MVKYYKILKVEEDVHEDLIKMQGSVQLESGKRVTISQVLRTLIAQQPKIDIFAKKSKSKP